MSTPTSDLHRKLWSKADAAYLLSISERVIDRLIADGDLETVPIGRRRLIPDAAIDEYIARLRRAS